MNLADATKRLEKFEHHLEHLNDKPSSQVQVNSDIGSWMARLHALVQDVNRIKRKAEALGDDRTALAAVAELRRIVELSAKLTGELEQRTQVNVLNVELTPETAERIAQTYLTRHRAQEHPNE